MKKIWFENKNEVEYCEGFSQASFKISYSQRNFFNLVATLQAIHQN